MILGFTYYIRRCPKPASSETGLLQMMFYESSYIRIVLYQNDGPQPFSHCIAFHVS